MRRLLAVCAFFLAVSGAAQTADISGTTSASVAEQQADEQAVGTPASTPPGEFPREPRDTLETQIALARLNISPGSIDGVSGPQTTAALTAFQMFNGLNATGRLDAPTRAALSLDSPPLATRVITAGDIASIQPLAPTWLGKSRQTTLAHASVLEMAAEQARASPALLRKLNPGVDWDTIKAGATITVPDAAPGAARAQAVSREERKNDRPAPLNPENRDCPGNAGILPDKPGFQVNSSDLSGRSDQADRSNQPGETARPAKPGKPEKAARVVIFLEERVLEAFAADGRLLAHFPVSIARDVAKRPVGTLRVRVIAPNPNYTFDPAIFTESEEGRELGRKLIIPPGPNNPVGLVWIGLDLPGYGIHGTPDPEKVGRTESHGCFRLANWNAVALLELVEIGTEVEVVP